jgi:hypothetical protein
MSHHLPRQARDKHTLKTSAVFRAGGVSSLNLLCDGVFLVFLERCCASVSCRFVLFCHVAHCVCRVAASNTQPFRLLSFLSLVLLLLLLLLLLLSFWSCFVLVPNLAAI